MLCVKNAKLILPDSLADDGMILADGDRILYAGPAKEIPEGAQVLDAGGLYAGPGFVDIHCHGGGCRSFSDDPAGAAEYHLLRGTTSVLATLGYGQEPNARLESARLIRKVMPSAPSILGIHMEGPFKNPNFGFPGKYQTPATLENAVALFDAVGDAGRLMMVAPDVENAEPILQELRRRGIRLSAGHGTGTRETYALFKKYGLIDATHHYCASGDYKEQRGVRKVGLDELVDLDDEVYAEIIADHEGRHVAPEKIRLCIRCKGTEKIILVTDMVSKAQNAENMTRPAVIAADTPDRPNRAEDCDIHWVNNSLDGSELNMSKACYNMKRHSLEPVETVWRMASRNPAAMLGESAHIGNLIPGANADIVIADSDFNVKHVVLKGRIIR